VRPEDLALLENGARYWHRWVAAAYLRAYLNESAHGNHLPKTPEGTSTLLKTYLIEKALYEITYELNNRPDWVRIPVRGLLDLLE
jgi:maltose alpha-D-glucosyltransferase/alpha-amylase